MIKWLTFFARFYSPLKFIILIIFMEKPAGYDFLQILEVKNGNLSSIC